MFNKWLIETIQIIFDKDLLEISSRITFEKTETLNLIKFFVFEASGIVLLCDSRPDETCLYFKLTRDTIEKEIIILDFFSIKTQNKYDGIYLNIYLNTVDRLVSFKYYNNQNAGKVKLRII